MKAFIWTQILNKYNQRIFRTGFIITSFVGIISFVFRDLLAADLPGGLKLSFTPSVAYILIFIYAMIIMHQLLNQLIEYFLCPPEITTHKTKANYLITQTILMTHPRILENFKNELFSELAATKFSDSIAKLNEEQKDRAIFQAYHKVILDVLTDHSHTLNNSVTLSTVNFDPGKQWDEEFEHAHPQWRIFLTIFYWIAFFTIFFGIYIYIPLRALAFLGIF